MKPGTGQNLGQLPAWPSVATVYKFPITQTSLTFS